MKKTIFYTVLAVIAASSIFTSCVSKEKKVEDAKEDVRDAKQELKEEQRDLNIEYPTFKTDAETKIADNEKRIAKLREKLNKPGKAPFDDLRKKRIDELEKKNAALKSRLYAYEKERSDWETFKREFNHDIQGIGDAFKDLGKDNTR